jgi:hypothetical protein
MYREQAKQIRFINEATLLDELRLVCPSSHSNRISSTCFPFATKSLCLLFSPASMCSPSPFCYCLMVPLKSTDFSPLMT